MANTPSVGDIIQMRIGCHLNGQNGLMIRHYYTDTVNTTGCTDQEFATHMDTALHTLIKAAMHEDAEYRGLGMQIIAPAAFVEQTELSNRGQGTETGHPLPTQSSGLISLRTNVAGRDARGRIYLPFPSEEHSDGVGSPDAAYKATMTSIADELIQTQTVAGAGGGDCVFLPVVYRRSLGTTLQLQDYIVRDFFATQRRRGRNASPNVPLW